MKVLSVRNPWAYFIIYGIPQSAVAPYRTWGHKDVENRTWTTKHRGSLLIHVPSKLDVIALNRFGLTKDLFHRFTGIIGRVNLESISPPTEVVVSPWAEHCQYHWILSDPVSCLPYPIKGKLGIWDFDENLLNFNIKE